MKSDFLLALTQLSAEKNLPADVVIGAIESALVSAYRKDSFAPTQNIAVKINPGSGKVEVWAEKIVVDKVGDRRHEISLEEAQRINPAVHLGDAIMVESTPDNAGRIAAQTAKQVILQRLSEAESTAIVEEYSSKEGDVMTGVIQRIEPGQMYIDLGRTEALMPASEQMRTERYRVGQRLKVVVLQVIRTAKGARVVVSRTHPELLRRLFELEVPEVFNGVVEIKSIAREAGFRSKIAVAAKQEGIDPVGCCVGLRGIRIQNVVKELSGEKIDVITWHPDPAVYIANALSPAHIISVNIDKERDLATVVVPDKQLSLAIGKEGQNARLAARLTGWRIDIKSASVAEAEKLERTRAAQEAAAAAGEELKEEVPVEPSTIEEIPEAAAQPLPVAAGQPAAIEEIPEEIPEPAAVETGEEVREVEEALVFQPETAEEKPLLRFAEDIMPAKSAGKPAKTKKKKGAFAKDGKEEGIKAKRQHREFDFVDEDEEY